MSAGPGSSSATTPPPSRSGGSGELKRSLGLIDIAALLVGNTLGSGIFVAPAAVAMALAGPAGAALWILGGLIAACGAVVYAECGIRLPRSGGFYACYRRVYGEPVAFVGGWAALLVTYPASIAAIALILGRYLGEIVPALAPVPWLPATTALLIVAVVNIAGVRGAAWTQRVLTSLKVGALALVCLAAVLLGGGGDGSVQPLEETGSPAGFPGAFAAFMGAMVVVLWTYDGWSDINMVAGEIRDPARSFGGAVLLGMGTLVTIYAAVQLAVARLLPEAAGGSPSVISDAVQAGLGPASGKLVALLVVVATFGAVHGIVLAASRLGFAMARDGVFFRWVGEVHPRLGTPARAVALLSAAAAVYVFVAEFRNLLGLFSFTVWIFYGLTAAGLLVLRRRRIGEAPGWTPPGAAAAPAVVILIGLAMATGLFVENPGRSLAGLALLLLGFPVYFAWRRLRPAV